MSFFDKHAFLSIIDKYLKNNQLNQYNNLTINKLQIKNQTKCLAFTVVPMNQVLSSYTWLYNIPKFSLFEPNDDKTNIYIYSW